ncbi:MAG: VPLPA-CTERM sorting domain-containing protein [Halioglobus sp.]|nr:VPLPA-CTERM sorting domain-containing protein [Halioglobus sp.]
MRNSFITAIFSAFAMCVMMASGAQAATFSYAGVVSNATGAFAALTPVGTAIAADITYDDGAVAAGLAGPGDVDAILATLGGFCFSYNVVCSVGTTVPITSIPGAAATFAGGSPTGGTLSVVAFSPSFQLSIPIEFDLTAGTFSASGGALGGVDGTFVYAPSEVPLPAAAWLFGSALFGLVGVARRKAKA